MKPFSPPMHYISRDSGGDSIAKFKERILIFFLSDLK